MIMLNKTSGVDPKLIKKAYAKAEKIKKQKVNVGGEKHLVYKKTNKKGKGEPGDIMVNHPTKDKGKWDTINLTKIAKVKTVKQGVAATKKWHRENPYPDKKKN